MFGNNDRRLEKLQKNGGVRARATITEAKRTHWAFTAGDPSIAANTDIIWKLKLQVQPDGQPPFEAELTQRYGQFGAPEAGDPLAVWYDPKDPSKVAIDDSAGAQIEASMEEHREWRAETGMDPKAQAYANNLEKAAFGDPYEFAEAFKKDKHAAILASKQRVRAAVAAAQAAGQVPGMGGLVVPPGMVTPGVPAPAPADPIEQLKQLADLRDRGVLTDAEFEAQKRRVLGEQ